MATTSFKRCLWLINTVRTFGPISFDDISRRWENSALNDSGEPLAKKTFHNHCDAIAEMFDIIIACERKNGYKYYIECENQIDKWSASLIDTFCMQVSVASDPKMKNRLIDYNTNYALIPPRTLNLVFEAIRSRLPITFMQMDKWTFNAFYPMFLIKVKQRWFVIGMFNNYKDRQIVPFELMWMSDVQILEDAKALEPPKDFDINKYMDYLIAKDSNMTFGQYYNEQTLRGFCEGTEKDLKKAVFDAYFVYLGSLEYLNSLPRGTAIKTAEIYYGHSLSAHQ